MNRSDKIYVAGHRGMVGSAIRRILEGRGFTRLKVQTYTELDLISQAAVQRFFEQEKLD